jgi:thioredoxin 1
MIKHLDKEENFVNEIQADKILVDFYAEWCGPCKMIGQIFESMEDEIEVLKVNTDEFPDLAQKFGVMSIPTVILFKNGSEVDKFIGLRSKEEILEFINK